MPWLARSDQEVGADAGPLGRCRAVPGGADGDDPFVVRALAMGLAMLGLFDAEHREWITDPRELAGELEKVRSEGVAFDIEERNLGTCAVVAPVRDQMGKVIATLGVVVPTGRFGPDERKACADAVKATAASLSEFFGYARSGAAVP